MEAHLALQQRIRELERENDQLVEIKSMYESAMATDRQRIKELRAAAITPEMRERIRTAEAEALKHLEHGIWEVKDIISDLRWNRRSTQIIRDVHGPIFRDLLGEQG